MADTMDSFQRGFGFGRGVADDAYTARRAQQIRGLAGQAYADPSQREALTAQMVAIDPEAGIAFGEQAQKREDNQLLRVEGLVKLLEDADKTDPRQAQSLWQTYGVPFARKFSQGTEPTANWAEAKPMVQQLKARIAMAKAAQGRAAGDNKVVGNALVNEAGDVIYQAPQQPRYFLTDQGLIEVGPNGPRELRLGPDGQPQQTFPTGGQVVFDPEMSEAPQSVQTGLRQWTSNTPDIVGGNAPIPAEAYADAERTFGTTQQPGGRRLMPATNASDQERLRLAREAAARSEEASRLAREAAEQRRKFGTIPQGMRVNAEGTALEQVPGAPAPAGSNPTVDEKKAATLLKRLEFSEQQLSDVLKKNPGAATPELDAMAAGNLPLVGDAAANLANSSARRQVEAAQLDILDAALTLGTGAAYTREQLIGYRSSYFPQYGDDKDTIAAKQARLKNVIEAAHIAAGRAGPQQGGASGAGSVIRYDAQGNRL